MVYDGEGEGDSFDPASGEFVDDGVHYVAIEYTIPEAAIENTLIIITACRTVIAEDDDTDGDTAEMEQETESLCFQINYETDCSSAE